MPESRGWAFYDITTSYNTATAIVCRGLLCSMPDNKSAGDSAGPAYDLVTGLGSLDAFPFFPSGRTEGCIR